MFLLLLGIWFCGFVISVLLCAYQGESLDDCLYVSAIWPVALPIIAAVAAYEYAHELGKKRKTK